VIVPCVGQSQSLLGSPSLCDLPTERPGLDEVGERALAVDLDDRKPLPVAGLEVRVAADVDLLELEAELVPGGLDDTPRGRTEVAPLGVEEDDAGYGYRPRVMVASETRWTARPYAAVRMVVFRPS
jgi:hypothetical protein